MGAGWDDLELDVVEGSDGRRLTTSISPMWELAVVPQGGIVAAMAVRAMERVVNDPSQTLRTITAMFAGQMAGGPVAIDVTVLRLGRTKYQLTATVRNPHAAAGFPAIAPLGAPPRAYQFKELRSEAGHV